MATHIPQNGIAALIHNSNNQAAANDLTSDEKNNSIFGEDGFTFGDIIDIINPLQHIPIINNFYRKLTGDVIAPAMEIAGGALFGGPFGAAVSAVTTAITSRFQDDSNSSDPDSPYIYGETNNTATAITNSAGKNNRINADDYFSIEKPDIKQINYESRPSSVNENWTLSSINRIDTHNKNLRLNTMQTSQPYQSADGIVNLAYKNTARYSEVITSTELPEKKIDIIIGSTAGAG